MSGLSSVSAISSEIWNGGPQLTNSTGHLNSAALLQALHSLTWRDLGSLLAYISQRLEKHLHDHKLYPSVLRSTLSLAITVIHMQQIYTGISESTKHNQHPVVPVHGKFSKRLFGLLLRAVSKIQGYSQTGFVAVARQVFKALAVVVCADENESGFPPITVVEAVQKDSEDGNGREKRRKKSEPTADNAQEESVESSSCLPDLFCNVFADSKSAHAHRYVVQILRARGSIILKNLLGSFTSDHLRQHRFAKALVDFGIAACSSDGVGADGVFAVIRDTFPLVPPAATYSSDTVAADMADSVRRLCLELSRSFEPHVPGDLVQYCVQKKLRCYQWAAMCRASTWLAQSLDSAGYSADIATVIAQSSRTSWLQIQDPAEFEDDLQLATMWALLVSESLCHANLEYPDSPGLQKVPPLYSSSLVTQSQVFSAVAVVIGKIGRLFSCLARQPGAVLFVSRILKACNHVIRSIPRSGSSMGLFAPYGTGQSYGPQLDLKFDSLGGFIFRPPRHIPTIAVADKPKLVPTDMEEQQREAAEEVETESALARVFVAVGLLADAVLDNDIRPLAVFALQTVLDWVNSFTVAARANAHRQEHALKNQAPVKIRVVGEHARLHRSATDWTRLQRLPIVHVGQTTCKDAVATAVSLLAAISGQPMFDDFEQILQQSLAATSSNTSKVARVLQTHLGADHFWRFSLSAMQTLGSILGVPAYLSTSDLDHLRLPQLHVRERSPRSSETLMIETLDTGIGKLLLDPQILVRFVECTRSGQLLEKPEAMRISQIWLDMIGTVFSHSLLRSRLNCLVATTSGPVKLDFEFWWLLALAASTRCHIDIAGVSAAPVGQLRLASMLLAHLTSWFSILRAETYAVRCLVRQPFPEIPSASCPGFEKLTGWLHSFEYMDRPNPMVNLVYVVACKLPLSVEMLKRSPEENDMDAAHVSRDICGIANDAAVFLRRMLNHQTFSSSFRHPKLIAEYAANLRCWLTDDNLPQRFRDAKQYSQTTLADSSAVFAEDEAALVAIPDMDGQGAGSEDDLVGQLLRDSAQLSAGATRKRPIHEYYTDHILGWLWVQYAGNLRSLAVPMVFGPRTSTVSHMVQPAGTDPTTQEDPTVLANLGEKLAALRAMYAQFTPYRHYIDAGCSLVCDDIAAYVPIHILRSATASATKSFNSSSQSPSTLDVCEFAALVLPDIADTNHDSNLDVLVEAGGAVARTLLANIFDGAGASGSSNQVHERCAEALSFFVWRQRRTILANLSTSLSILEHNMSTELNAMRPHIPQLSAAIANTSADVEAIRLCGDESDSANNSVITSLQLLTSVSPVFEAMLLGNFAESQRRSGNDVRCVQLQCGAHTLESLFRIFHSLVQASKTKQLRILLGQMSSSLSKQYSTDELVQILDLANYYAVRPVVSLLLWFFANRVQALKLPTGVALEALASMVADNWSVYYFDESVALSCRRPLVALVLFSLDGETAAQLASASEGAQSAIDDSVHLLTRRKASLSHYTQDSYGCEQCPLR